MGIRSEWERELEQEVDELKRKVAALERALGRVDALERVLDAVLDVLTLGRRGR